MTRMIESSKGSFRESSSTPCRFFSLKGGQGMYRMKGDMAGGATVLAVMKIISKLNQPSMSSGSYRRSRTFPVHARRSRGMSTANLGFISTSPARPGRPTPRRTGTQARRA